MPKLMFKYGFALKGAVTAIFSSYIFIVLFTYFYRFPIMFVGFLGPYGDFGGVGMTFFELAYRLVFVWLGYGVFFGGFLFQAVIGGVFGELASRFFSGSNYKSAWVFLISALSAIPLIFCVSLF